jgi:DNA-binding transcriptional regulator YiaG
MERGSLMVATATRYDQLVHSRRERNPHAAMTSMNLGLDVVRSAPWLTAGSTSAPTEHPDIQLAILFGNETALVLRSAEHLHRWDVTHVRPLRQTQAHSFDSIDDVQWLRNSLALSMAEIANLFKVTRKAVYDWVDGSKPRLGVPERIHAIRLLLENGFPKDCLPYVRQFWSTSNDDSPSLLSILRDHETKDLTVSAEPSIRKLAAQVQSFVAQLKAKPIRQGIERSHADDIFRSI